MALDKVIFAFAGAMIIVGLVLGLNVHAYWFGLPAFVGLNMFQAAFTGLCPLAILLKKMGVKPGKAFS
ncbi:MAG: sulfurtransferase [Robiginitomaculum sp.]|nr:MAG: sulfurtransferase [Robiginitomaculum sp.]